MWRSVLCGVIALSVGCNLFSSTQYGADGDVGSIDSASDAEFADARDAATESKLDAESADADVDADAACAPESDEALCSRLVVNCDTINAEDNCGNVRTATCGVCTTPAVC